MSRYRVIDAFTETPGTGNPAAVVLLDSSVPESWAHTVAAEFNLSETAFAVSLPEDVEADYELRWFTPEVEVALCGHATLATAHALFEDGVTGPIRFATRSSGVLTVRRDAGMLWMDFPATVLFEVDPPAGLAHALGAEPRWTGLADTGHLLAVLDDERTLRELAPVPDALRGYGDPGLIVTAEAALASPYAFVSRVFAPAVGIPEDPVTGSAHSILAPFWSQRLGVSECAARQCSPRGGALSLRLPPDAPGRVFIGGRAVTVAEGRLFC